MRTAASAAPSSPILRQPDQAKPAAPAMHQRLEAWSDRVDQQARGALAAWMIGDRMGQHPKSVMVASATGFAATFADSAARHSVGHIRGLLCDQVLGGLGRGAQSVLGSCIDRLAPGRLELPPPHDIESHAGSQQTRGWAWRHRAAAEAGDPRAHLKPATRGARWAQRALFPYTAGVELIALAITAVAVLVGLGASAITLVLAGVVSTAVVCALAYEKPRLMTFLASDTLRTSFKMAYEAEQLREGWLAGHVSTGAQRHRLLAHQPAAPSADQALQQLSETMKLADDELSLREQEDARQAFAEALVSLAVSLVGLPERRPVAQTEPVSELTPLAARPKRQTLKRALSSEGRAPPTMEPIVEEGTEHEGVQSP